jgi:hypothetical protein
MKVHSLRRTAVVGAIGLVAALASVSAAAGSAQAAGAAPTRTVLSASPSSIVLGQNAKLKAVVKPVTGTGQPAGSITFNEGATVLGTVNLAVANNVETAKLTVPGLGFGTHNITATYNGSPTFAASTSLIVIVNVTKNATTTTITSAATSTPGTYKLNATVKVVAPGTGIPSGLVTYVVDGGAPQIVALNAFGKAPLTVMFIVGTSHTVTATYGGGTTMATSNGTLTFTA